MEITKHIKLEASWFTQKIDKIIEELDTWQEVNSALINLLADYRKNQDFDSEQFGELLRHISTRRSSTHILKGEAILTGVPLQEVDLRDTILEDTILEGAILERAILEKAEMTGANLKKANLTGANLTEAKLEGSSMEGTILTGANMTRARLMFATFDKDTNLQDTILIDILNLPNLEQTKGKPILTEDQLIKRMEEIRTSNNTNNPAAFSTISNFLHYAELYGSEALQKEALNLAENQLKAAENWSKSFEEKAKQKAEKGYFRDELVSIQKDNDQEISLFQFMPNDIKKDIVGLLDTNDKSSMALVNKEFAAFVNDDRGTKGAANQIRSIKSFVEKLKTNNNTPTLPSPNI